LAARYGQIDQPQPRLGQRLLVDGYRTYDEIDLPQHRVTVPKPAHELDFRRFASDAVRAQRGPGARSGPIPTADPPQFHGA
jgi:beta-galactosidase